MPHHDEQLRKKIQAAHSLAEKASAGGLLPYLHHVVIDTRPEPRLFRDAAEPWQWGLAEKYGQLFENVAGLHPSYSGPLNGYLGLAKGHDKSSMIGRFVNFALAFSRRPWNGYVYAEDRDQAGLLLDAMATEARLNPWLRRHLHFKNWVVTGRNHSRIQIEAADAASSQGIRPDLVICDELTHWTDEEVFKSVLSGVRKRPGCVLFIISNAGLKFSWSFNVREMARTSPKWLWYEAPGRLATWMDDDAIAEDRKLLPPSMAARLYDNKWVDPGEGCNYIHRSEAQACADLGIQLGLTPRDEGEPGKFYFAAVDYGAVKDRCVLSVLHRHSPGLVAVDRMDVWQGSRERPTQIASVERWIDDVRKKFNLSLLVIDKYQMDSTIQRYSGLVPIMTWESRGGQRNYELAQVLRAAIVNKQVAWYPGCGDVVTDSGPHTLVDELSELITREFSYGYRLDHLPGLHDDRAVCLGMALVQLLKSEERRPLYLSEFFF